MASCWHEDECSEDVPFYCLATERTIKVCLPDMKGKSIATSGSGHLEAIDKANDMSSMCASSHLLGRPQCCLACLSSSTTIALMVGLLVKGPLE
uniref:Uncharacterized protein n=1 Tax=Leersia perrieri TaxID=77586 RepID=A0A0D9V1N2_9ORYZ